MRNKVISLFGNNEVIQKEGVKYSELLENFMTPFQNAFFDAEFTEDIVEFSILAWNFGNMKVIVPNEDFKKIISTAPNQSTDFALLKKMIDYKAKNYKKHTNFIVDFELKGTDENPILSVITQEKDAYLATMFDDLDEQTTQEDDFEENYINRSAIVLKPQQPFIDWYFNLNPEDELDFEEDIKETNIYLVDDKIDDVEKWLKKKFDKFFMMELDEWFADKKAWPQKRNYKMFNLWFRVEISEMIYDLEKRPVLKSE